MVTKSGLLGSWPGAAAPPSSLSNSDMRLCIFIQPRWTRAWTKHYCA